MSTLLNQLADNEGARKSRVRVGRGTSSGKGKTCGRGVKGQKSRSGVSIKGFEGGQMPIYRRLPKRGFTNTRRVELETINIGVIQNFVESKKLDAKKTITSELLKETGIIKNITNGVKLLGKGKITAKITIEVEAASASAVTAVEKAGGKVTIVSTKKKASGKEGNSKKTTSPDKNTKKAAA